MKDLAAKLGGVVAIAAAVVLGLGGVSAADPSVECGKPGLPACPLQAWMRANVAAPLAGNEAEALATGLEKAAKLAPDPTWSSWAPLAQSGAAAARKGDLAAARAACKGCHDAWRASYRAQYRHRPIAP